MGLTKLFRVESNCVRSSIKELFIIKAIKGLSCNSFLYYPFSQSQSNFKLPTRSVLGHCDECSKMTKYTGFRTFNSIYPCHDQGDLSVHLSGMNHTLRLQITEEFMKNADLESGTFDSSNSLMARSCPLPLEHKCSTRAECDREYHGLNTHGKCHAVGK